MEIIGYIVLALIWLIAVEIMFYYMTKDNVKSMNRAAPWFIVKLASLLGGLLITAIIGSFCLLVIMIYNDTTKTDFLIGTGITIGTIVFFLINRYWYKKIEKKYKAKIEKKYKARRRKK